MRMRTIIKATLAAGAIAALAWPLLFAEKPESLANSGRNIQQNNMRQTTFAITPQSEPVW
jgi:hypothetical protein